MEVRNGVEISFRSRIPVSDCPERKRKKRNVGSEQGKEMVWVFQTLLWLLNSHICFGTHIQAAKQHVLRPPEAISGKLQFAYERPLILAIPISKLKLSFSTATNMFWWFSVAKKLCVYTNYWQESPGSRGLSFVSQQFRAQLATQWTIQTNTTKTPIVAALVIWFWEAITFRSLEALWDRVYALALAMNFIMYWNRRANSLVIPFSHQMRDAHCGTW